MINHTRTIILNENGPRLPTKTIAGDEYIPPYGNVALPEPLRDTERVLFGSDPDYEGKVFRITQYMKLMHNSDYEDYVLRPDPRITYDPYDVTAGADDISDFQSGNYGLGVVLGGRDFSVLGEWDEGGSNGRVVTTWQIVALTSTSILIVNNVTQENTTYESLGGTKLLPGSTLRVAVNTQPLPAGQTWTVSYRSRPQPDIGAIVATLKALPTTAMAAVFGTGGFDEPIATFYKLFTKHPMLPQQLTGFLLAYASRLDALRST